MIVVKGETPGHGAIDVYINGAIAPLVQVADDVEGFAVVGEIDHERSSMQYPRIKVHPVTREPVYNTIKGEVRFVTKGRNPPDIGAGYIGDTYFGGCWCEAGHRHTAIQDALLCNNGMNTGTVECLQGHLHNSQIAADLCNLATGPHGT
jgi:hypothetical protein